MGVCPLGAPGLSAGHSGAQPRAGGGGRAALVGGSPIGRSLSLHARCRSLGSRSLGRADGARGWAWGWAWGWTAPGAGGALEDDPPGISFTLVSPQSPEAGAF